MTWPWKWLVDGLRSSLCQWHMFLSSVYHIQKLSPKPNLRPRIFLGTCGLYTADFGQSFVRKTSAIGCLSCTGSPDFALKTLSWGRVVNLDHGWHLNSSHLPVRRLEIFFFVWVNSGQFLVEKNMSCYFLATRFYNHDFFPTRFYIWWDCTTVLRRQVFVVRKSLLGLALLVVFWIQFFVVTSNQESGPLVIRKMQVDRGFWKVSRLKVLLTTLPKTNSKRRWK